MLEAIAAGLLLAALLGAVAWLRARWWRSLRASASTRLRGVAEARRRRGALAERQRRVAAAEGSGEMVALGAVGMNPTRVTWAGAEETETFHYRDLERYKRDVAAGRAPHLRSFCCGRPPRVGDRRKSTLSR